MSLPPWLRPLSSAWAGQRQWRVLDASGQPHHLLALHAAAHSPPGAAALHLPPLLHYVLRLDDGQHLRQHAPAAWQAQLRGLLPGVHRLTLALADACALELTLWLGDSARLLRQQQMVADTLLLGGDARPWLLPHALKPLLRHAQRGSQLLAPPDASMPALGQALAASGWHIQSQPQPGAGLCARFDPPWPLRKTPATAATPGHALVLGAGLAGSSVAYSLARRGWQVTVLGAGAAPADGASGLPAGLFCPHVSPDDCALSRLSRAGLQLLLPRLEALCQPDQDWARTGVLERSPPSQLPWRSGPGLDWSHPAPLATLVAAGLSASTGALWHAQAGWLRPQRLVAAQLRHPGIRFVGQAAVARLEHSGAGWLAWNAQGQPLLAPDPEAGQAKQGADIAILAAGPASAQWLPAHWPVLPVRGQVSWGRRNTAVAAGLPPFPVNGAGNLVPDVPFALPGAALLEGDGEGAMPTGWVMGSTFERGQTQLPAPVAEQAAAHAHNLGKLAQLLPASAALLAPAFTPGQPDCHPTWGQVRLTSRDRLPLVGPVPQQPNLYTLTALGARGITLAALCGELLAAQLHAEPLPLEAALAQQLGSGRLGRGI